jgi:hypothetical protein
VSAPEAGVEDGVDTVEGPTGRIVVTGGGAPSAEEVAALVVALTPAVPEPGGVATPAWRRAALTEGVGGPQILTPAALDGPVNDRWA